MEFSTLELVPELKQAIAEAGFVTATPVQAAVFPHALEGGDIYAQSQTGTGKTAAFLVPILNRIMTVPEARTRKVLVLAPTRELAVQIEGEAKRLAKHLPVRSACFYGGVGYGPQYDALRDNVELMIGTPGRIIDLVQQGKMLLKTVGFLVIDEADRMFDMGFIDDLRKLIRFLPGPSERQTFLFSATLGLRVKDLAWEYMDSPKEIVIEAEHVTVDLVTQELHHVGVHEKMRLLLGVLERENPGSAIVFANQKAMVEEISRRLRINGIENEYIMGDLPQSKRLQIIEDLKAGRLRILVATDVAARGLDIEALDLVVNYDLPDDRESYVHRIGRTARAGKAGKAVSFACEKFVFNLPDIEKFIGMKIPVAAWDASLVGVEDRSEGMRFGRSHGPDRHPGRDGGRPRDGGRDGGRGRGAGRPREEGRQDGGRAPEHRRETALRHEGKPELRHHDEARRGEDPRREGADRGTVHGQSRKKGRQDADAQTAGTPGQGPDRARASGPARAPVQDASKGPAGLDNPYSLSQEERLRLFKEKYGVTPPRPGDKQPAAKQGGAPKDRRGAKGSGGNAATRGQASPAAARAAASAGGEATQKPGLLKRILGIFSRKD